MKLILDIFVNARKIALLFLFTVLSHLSLYSFTLDDIEINDWKGVGASGDSTKVVSHTYFLLGNGGNISSEAEKKAFKELKKELDNFSSDNSTIIFLGNNTKGGISKKDVKEGDKKLDRQITLAKYFKGNTVFINGNEDWKRGYEGVKRLSTILEEKLENKKALLPRKVCGYERLKINEETILITVDSQWFLEDWNKHPNINEDCDIKTREDFFNELRGEINKNQNKVVILAMHHPVFSNGNYGGKFSFKDHLFPFQNGMPLPLVGSVINYTRAMSGIDPQDLQSKKYNELNKRIRTMAQMFDNVIIVSGHEHNLQFIERDNIKQVISGALGDLSFAREVVKEYFATSSYGYAQIDVLKDKTAILKFYTYSDDKYALVYEQPIISFEEYIGKDLPILESETIQASVYPNSLTQKTGWYRFLWGEHYRDIYGRPVEVEIGYLDKIKGGLTPLISGGGNQSMSLRLVDAEGKQYVMRGVKKSVSRFVQSAVFKDQYVMNSFENTWAERFIYDFYTTAHPYTPFIIGDLSEVIGLYHTNPELYYIPKQPLLGKFNEKYGDELYMIEERPSEGYEDEDSFGNAKKIISTTDVIAKLRKDEKYSVDQKAFLRARIFDMLIGDWDRHGDQWRWSEFDEGDRVIYRPVPRDRDQAFAKIDGALLKWIMKLPPLRHMQNYKEEFANPRWLNMTAFPLDQYLLKSTTEQDWINEAKDIVATLDDDTIDAIFAKLPKEVQDEEIENIKRVFKARKENILAYLPKYYHKLREYVVLTGTDKKDSFEIERLANGEVKVMQYRDKKAGKELQFEKIYSPTETKEIWLYGLNDEDVFTVTGNEKAKIKLRLIGGKNKDLFNIENTSKVIVYDYADKKNEIIDNGSNNVRKFISNSYDLNNFNYVNIPIRVNMLLPNIGYNPEDGVKLGFMFSSKQSKFVRDPFSSKHVLKGFYSFNTKGVELDYKGYFPNATNRWMFTIAGRATSPNFAINYYGMGNETFYFDKKEGNNYKRVRIESYSVSPGYRYEGERGGNFEANISYEALKVQNKSNRFITSSPDVVNQNVFDYQQYGTIKGQYSYEQYNYPANPTIGFGFNSTLGWKMNLKEEKQNFAFLDMKVNFIHFIDRGERFVLATNFNYQTRFNNNYEFYHAATAGGNANLRGFRPERFTGKTSFVHTTDIRFNAGQFTAGFIPMSYGFYGGFDYGRVWLPNEKSNKWHNSYGAGFWINAIEQATLHLSYFNSVDGGRLVFGLGFGF